MTKRVNTLVGAYDFPAKAIGRLADLVLLSDESVRTPIWHDSPGSREFFFSSDGAVGYAIRVARPGKEPDQVWVDVVRAMMRATRAPEIDWCAHFGILSETWSSSRQLDRAWHRFSGRSELLDLPRTEGLPATVPGSDVASRRLVDRALAFLGLKAEEVLYWTRSDARYLLLTPASAGKPLDGDFLAVLPAGPGQSW